MSGFVFLTLLVGFSLLVLGLVLTVKRFRHEEKLSADTYLFLLVSVCLLAMGLVIWGLLS